MPNPLPYCPVPPRRFPWRTIAAAIALSLGPSPLWAQQIEPQTASTVVVTAQRGDVSAPSPMAPVQTLAGDELTLRRQSTLGETLAGLPGVHLDNFGGGAGRPVIRGQTLPRIEILSDGAMVFDAASISPDHAIVTDPLLLDSIEIVRGPAAVIYGGNAVTGAVNLLDSKVPKAIPRGGVSGSGELRYGAGNQDTTAAARVTAGIGQFAVHVEASRHRADDYDVPDAFGSDKLRDSFANGSSVAAGVSWITSKGYIGAAFTRQNADYGLPGHSHANGLCHNHGDELHCQEHGSYVDPYAAYDDSHTARIKLRSERADVRVDYRDLFPGIAHTRLRLSHTDYEHDEIDGEMIPVHYSNKAHEARLDLTHTPLFGFSGTFGVQYTDSLFTGLNSFPLKSRTRAAFLTERRAFGAVDIEAGVRKEWREAGITEREMTWLVPDSPVNPVSVSAGADWKLGGGYSVVLNVSRSERAPGLRELYAAGNNLATNSFELGLVGRSWFGVAEDEVSLVETTKALDVSLRKTSGATTFEIGAYRRNVDNYVFARLLDQDPVRNHRLLMYNAADVRFKGIDGQISHQLDRSSTVTLFGDYVRAELKDGSDRVPRIPPARLGARYNRTVGPLSTGVEYVHTLRQDRIASYETETAGYGMLDATLMYRFDAGQAKNVEFYLRGSNLLDKLAYVHTSFVKTQSPLRGRHLAMGLRHQF
jgi:iron complex outermembrane receptor protein